MTDDPLYITVDTLTRITILPIYALLLLLVYSLLWSYLSTSAKRIVIFALALNLLAIVKAAYIEPSSSFEVWLWDVHGEWNFPATISSIQLAMAGGIALVISLSLNSSFPILRIYFCGLFLAFISLALDEYFLLHESGIGMSRDRQKAIGVALVATTLIVASRSPRSLWKWLACLLTGLAIGALGELHIEMFGGLCGDYGWLYLDECPDPQLWPIEEYLSLMGIWLILVAMLGLFAHLSRDNLSIQRTVYMLPILWLILILPFAPNKSSASQVGGLPADITFTSGADLHAYQIHERRDNLTIRLWMSPSGIRYDGLGYSISLVDQVTRNVVVGADELAHHQLEFHFAPGFVPVNRQWTRLDYPPRAPTNRAFWIILTLWREQDGEFQRDKIVSSDLPLLDETQVILGELVLPAETVPATSAPLATFDSGFALEAADMPDYAQAGETLDISFAWRADEAGEADAIQFLHLGNEESGEWFVYDQSPLGMRLPTRLWYPGLADSETWQVPLPADLAPGRYSVFTGLYRASDQERIPATDAEGTPWHDSRIAVSDLIVE